MDPNGLRFWLLADERDWLVLEEPAGLEYDGERGTLRLASQRDLREGPVWSDDEAVATQRLEPVPQAIDQFGTRAFWDAGSGKIMATGALPNTVQLPTPALEQVTDLAIGYDGVLYIATNGRVLLYDLRDRWDPVTLEKEGFAAWRLAADPSGGVWVLDRDNHRLGRVIGLPLRRRPYVDYEPDVFRPCEENPDPPRLTVLDDATWPAEEIEVALACSPQGRVALLTWVNDGDARLRLLGPDLKFADGYLVLRGVRRPYSLTWVSSRRVAVLLSDDSEAPAYRVREGAEDLEGEENVLPVGDLYPLREHDGGPFLHGVTLPPHYPVRAGSSPLHLISLPSFAREGEATNEPSHRLIDSGSAQTVWHRLYLEAAIPQKCGMTVRLAATNEPGAPTSEEDWHEHRFGQVFETQDRQVPRGVWLSIPSELPFHPGLLACEPQEGRHGLFSVLIQRPNRRVRSLRGRYLWVRVKLYGDGRTTPELTAMRVYASRFSYLENYLPELYRESVFGLDGDETRASTPADFLERFVDNFESVLTPLEDRIANTYLLTDPATVPEEVLEWLASWVGLTFDSAFPTDRRRQLLRAAMELYRWHGTVRGLNLALDIATGGGVQGGEIVVLEDFKFRRTFATILGADLADEHDPLLAGLAVSGNSFVGDTLFLGDENKKEFLALFSADLPKSEKEEIAVEALYDRLAHRLTVLVHEAIEPQGLGLIRRIVELEAPAHVESRVVAASHPLVVGIASLVGVDTYLRERPGAPPVEVQKSRIGLRDVIQRPPSLDPRLEGGVS